jgi:hypothetical protein
MTISGRELARRVGGRVEVRADPLRSRLRLRGLTSSDEHEVEITFAFSVIALAESAERQMLAETFLSDRDVIVADDVASHFLPALREAASRQVATRPAEQWLDESNRAGLVEVLRSAAKPVAFVSGVELVSPFELSVESPTLQREKLQAMQRRLVERRAAGQAEHVQRAAELLKQFQSLRSAAPQLSPGKILEQISPADRGNMLQTLLLASGDGTSRGTQSLWTVAGPNLVRIDLRTSPPRCEITPLPTDLGPLRSVQSATIDGAIDAGRRLLIGAQGGVIVLDPLDPNSPQQYADREITSPLGFNSAAATSDMIWATHGDAGVVAWRLDDAVKPAITLRPERDSGGAKNCIALDEHRVLYSVGGNALISQADGSASSIASSAAAIIHIAVASDAIALIHSDGAIHYLDRETLQSIRIEKRAGESTAAGTLPWLGDTRLLLATADGPICCVGGDDPLVTQYVSAHRGLRAIAATSDLIAGISGDRQRIIFWKSWDGRQPAGEIHIGNLARHRAADIAFA